VDATYIFVLYHQIVLLFVNHIVEPLNDYEVLMTPYPTLTRDPSYYIIQFEFLH